MQIKKDGFMKKKEKNNSRIISRIVLTIVSLALFMLILIPSLKLVKEPTQTFLIKKDILSDEEIVEALILREEEVITDNSNRFLQQEKFEGEKVSKGTKIFRYFSTQESKKIDRIQEIDEEIQEYLIEQQDNINSPENTIIDNSIESKLLELNSLNQQSKILNFEKNITDEILQKAKIAGELSKEGTKIKELLDEKKDIENTLSAQSEIVYAPIAGVVSYRVDGFENKFNKKDLKNINQKTISEYDIKSGSIIPETNNKCKIVNNFETYLTLISKSEDSKDANVGDKIKIRIANEEETEATIEAINDAGKDKKIFILKLTTNSIQLLNYRKLKIEIIWWEQTGLKINNKSILKEDDYSYVVRQKGRYLEKILVKIIKETDDFSLITNYTTDELSKMKIDTTENRMTINEDDVILINPEKYSK